MSNKKKAIDLMSRESLVTLGIKLKVKGYTNKFSSPYLKKEEIKRRIIDFVKAQKKIQRSKSMTNFNSNVGHPKNLKRTQSLPNLTGSGNINNLSNTNNTNINTNNTNINTNNINCIYPKTKKLVAIGDIHGDLSVAIKALKLAGVINMSIPDDFRDITKINWMGGNTFVVQLGDQIDRVSPNKLFNDLCTEDNNICDDEGSDLKIICLFEQLHQQAIKQGGALLSILGNHELMNVDKDFRYVSPREFSEFGNYFKGNIEVNSKYPYGYKERLEAFKPGGILSKKLACSRFSVVQVGSWVFVHGGISPECANDYSLDEINYYIRKWLDGDESLQNMHHVNKLYHNDNDEYSPFWTRIYSDMDEWCDKKCIYNFNKTINNLNLKNLRNNSNIIKGMIMGHSPQFMYNKSINSSANNKIWRVDVGASRAFGEVDDVNRLVQVLVINDDENFSILREKQ
jgi:hypothetical protein